MEVPTEASAAPILRVFICYRREDSAGHAGRLYDALATKLGKDQVFMDVAGIDPGADFVERIEESVSASHAMLVVIGRNWLESGPPRRKRRLADPNDYVRLEISTALRKNIRLIPILVQGAAIPVASSLPEEIRRLARRQGFELRDDRWTSDIAGLVAALERLPPSQSPQHSAGPADAKPTEYIAPPADRVKEHKSIGLLRKIGFSALALIAVVAIVLIYPHLSPRTAKVKIASESPAGVTPQKIQAATPNSESRESYPPCVEHGLWAQSPFENPDDLALKFENVDPTESRAIKQRSVMSFHVVGNSGDFNNHLPDWK
jgi:hypothetical protein